MAICIKRVPKNVLGESRGDALPCKDTSWWNEEVKIVIKIKRDSYRYLKENCIRVSFERYKPAKKAAKKDVQNEELKCIKKYMRSWTPKRLKRIYIELLE